ncbi:MAG: hypothetical protein ACH34X_19475 [Thiolinea sp.]
MLSPYSQLNEYKKILNNFPISFDKEHLEVFDKESFKIQGDNKKIEIEKHCAAFDGMKDYFKQFLNHRDSYKNHLDLESYSSNRPIYGTFCSYFRSYVHLKNNKNCCISFITNKNFVAIEAGFQVNDLIDKELFNKIVISLIKENDLFLLSAFNFDLLYTFIGKPDKEVPLEELLESFENNDLKDGGIFQFRWKISREFFEAQSFKLLPEMINAFEGMIDFLKELEGKMPVINISGTLHGFRSTTFSLGLIDNDLLLSRQQLINTYPNILEANHQTVFPNAVENVKKQLIDFFAKDELPTYVSLNDSYEDSTEIEWENNEEMIDQLPFPTPEKVDIKNLTENDSLFDITFVVYRLINEGCCSYRLKTFSSPLKFNILDNDDIDATDYEWHFIKDIFQDGNALRLVNDDSWELYGESRLYVFSGNDLIYTYTLPELTASSSYYHWDEKHQVELAEHAEKITEEILSVIDDILSEDCEELV